MKTNNIKHSINKVAKDGTQFKIDIRLNDECKNGHQDFSITGSMWEAGESKIDRNMISCGAIGDKIAAEFPEFEIFNRLHLCDYLGVPMHAVANGFYHLKNGFNNVKPDAPEFRDEFCKYYRVSAEQFDALKIAPSKEYYAFTLMELRIPAQWKQEADEAIETLEEMTGKEFLIDSERTQLDLPSGDQMLIEKNRFESGYYEPAKIEQRAKEKAESDLIELKLKLKADHEKTVKKSKTELEVKLFMLDKGFKLDSLIYYSHSNTVCFNWMESIYRTKVTEKEFNDFCDGLTGRDFETLPTGIEFELKGVKRYSMR